MRNGFLILLAPALGLVLVSCAGMQTKRPELQEARPTPAKSGRPSVLAPAPAPTPAKQVGGMGQPLPPQAKNNISKVRELEAAGDYMHALKESVNFSVSATTPQEQESFRLKSVELVEG